MKIEKVVIEKSCTLNELNPGDMFLWTNMSSEQLDYLQSIQNDIAFNSVHILCDDKQKLYFKSQQDMPSLNVDSGLLVMINSCERVIKVKLNS